MSRPHAGSLFGRILTSYALTAPSSRQSCREQPLAQFFQEDHNISASFPVKHCFQYEIWFAVGYFGYDGQKYVPFWHWYSRIYGLGLKWACGAKDSAQGFSFGVASPRFVSHKFGEVEIQNKWLGLIQWTMQARLLWTFLNGMKRVYSQHCLECFGEWT